MNAEVIDLQSLKFFTPFQSYTDKQLDYINSHSEVLKTAGNQVVLDINSDCKDKFFLLEGSLKLLSLDNASRIIKANSVHAKAPVAQLRPSRYKVTTISPSKILVLTEEVCELLHKQEDNEAESFELSEDDLDDVDQILYELIFELQQGNFTLPSLPNIALRIRETITDEDSSAADIAKIIISDPVITAKVIKAANSAMYQRRNKAEDCKTAVVGLGTKVTSQLVTAFTMQELFKSPSELLTKHMQAFWEHSIEIAAISSILAKITPGFSSQQALLAGLVHDIGNVAILNKALEYSDVIASEASIERLLSKMSNQVTSSILQSWNFSEDMVLAAKEAENWMRDENSKPDLADIINIAHLHSYIGTDKQKTVPIIDQVPAFNKMALGKLTPELSINVLKESNKQIEQIKSIFQI
ncbi:MAG: HDOD domain-containing protein [gamma proteobacterium symbiont of Taylorina sp.]|nr:HDOD domain-containing protein [gamma proteobacterium symbiont of Taylorina sp.]